MIDGVYIVIIAGGRGERFWPLSTSINPKPFLKLIDGKSLIELTYLRAKRLVSEERILFVVGEEHLKALLDSISGINMDSLILEPEGRDTAPCIAYSALLLEEKKGDSVMVVFPADHYIEGEETFQKAIEKAVEFAEKGDYLVTFGITPQRPETGYGYIKVGESLEEGEIPVYRVETFVEKPSYEKAKEYLDSGQYYWNSGIFVWRTKVILSELERYLPDLLLGVKECVRLYKEGDREKFIWKYKNLKKISIDYGVMEKSNKVLMVRGDFLWDDVGTWSSLFRLMAQGEKANVTIGDPFILDVEGSLIFSQGVKLGVVGLKDVIVVATEKGVLVCSQKYAQTVRDIARHFSSK